MGASFDQAISQAGFVIPGEKGNLFPQVAFPTQNITTFLKKQTILLKRKKR
jgi:hypothetical protein